MTSGKPVPGTLETRVEAAKRIKSSPHTKAADTEEEKAADVLEDEGSIKDFINDDTELENPVHESGVAPITKKMRRIQKIISHKRKSGSSKMEDPSRTRFLDDETEVVGHRGILKDEAASRKARRWSVESLIMIMHELRQS